MVKMSTKSLIKIISCYRVRQPISLMEGFYSISSSDLRRLFGSFHLPDGLSRLHPKAVLLHKIYSRRALLWSPFDGLFHGICHLPYRRSSAFEFGKAARQSH